LETIWESNRREEKEQCQTKRGKGILGKERRGPYFRIGKKQEIHTESGEGIWCVHRGGRKSSYQGYGGVNRGGKDHLWGKIKTRREGKRGN